MDQFQIILKAIFEKAGVEQSLRDVQTLAKKLPIEMTAKLNSASTRNDFKRLANEIAIDFNKSLNLNLTGKDIMSAYDQMISGAKKASKEQEKLTAKMEKTKEKAEQLRISEEKRQRSAQTNAINKSLEQEGMQQERLANQMGKVREKAEQLRASEEKRQQASQSNAINKSLDQEYIQRDKLLAKIKESQNVGTLKTKFDTTAASYTSLEKLGTVTDKLKTDFAQLKVAHDALGRSTSDEELIANYKKFNTVLNTVNNTLKQTKLSTSGVNSQALQLQKITFENQIKTWLRLNSGAGDFKNRMTEIASQIKAVDKIGLNSLKQQFRAVNSEAQALGVLGKNLGDRFKEAASKFSMWFGTTALIMKTVRTIKTMWTNVVALDTALVDYKKTTTATTAQLEEFYYRANDVAKQMGVTTSEIITQASAWSRLGFSAAEVSEKMAKLSSQFSSISPDMDTDTATDGLVSIMKAFDIDPDNVLDGIMSKVNAIGNTAATSNGEIVNMLTKSSSAMKEANNTLEETIALQTAAVEITRDDDSVGTAYKTVSMRLRGYNEETESYTNNVEELSGTIADLTKTASTPGGISLFADANKTEYKSTYRLLEEISNIYSQLTDKNQADLLEAIAGRVYLNA